MAHSIKYSFPEESIVNPNRNLCSSSSSSDSSENLANEVLKETEFPRRVQHTVLYPTFPVGSKNIRSFMNNRAGIIVCSKSSDEGSLAFQNIIEERIPEIKKMFLVSKMLNGLAVKMCSNLRDQLVTLGNHLPSIEESEIARIYIDSNAELLEHASKVQKFANTLVETYDDLLKWCKGTSENSKFKPLSEIRVSILKQMSDYQKLEHNLADFIDINQKYNIHSYGLKVFCLDLLSTKISVKMYDLLIEVLNLKMVASNFVSR